MTALRSIRSLLAVLFACSLLAVISAQDAQAQEWRQNARIITPVENVPPWEGPRGALSTLLDSLVFVAESEDGNYRLRRSPQGEKMSVTEIKTELIDEEGIGLKSASHAIISYRFELDGKNDFQESIKTIQYIFRRGEGQEDISMIHIDAQKDWVQRVLYRMGTPTSENLDANILFRTQLRFTKVSEESGAQLVEIGNRTVREGFEEKKKDFVERVYDLTYGFSE